MNENKTNDEAKIEFVPATCPKCGGNLEIDSSFEVAYCKDCGSQVFIKNAKRKDKHLFDKVVSLLERQQELVRQDNKDLQRIEIKKELHNEKLKEAQNKRKSKILHDLFYIIVVLVIIGVCVLLSNIYMNV